MSRLIKNCVISVVSQTSKHNNHDITGIFRYDVRVWLFLAIPVI